MSQFSSQTIRSLLLSYEELGDKYQQLGGDYKYPYFYDVSKESQKMFFLGVHHSFDPNDKLFERINNYWLRFLKETVHSKKVVFTEGGSETNKGVF